MLISIITATYNSEKTIEKTLLSILNQTINDFEYIIIDGNSTDATISIIKKYKSAFEKKGVSLKWISEADSGIYEAWNKGIHISKGQWIGFLGSDDCFYSNALEKYKEILATHKGLDYISSKVKLVEGKKHIKTISGEWKWKTFRRYMNVAHVGSLHSRDYYQKYGQYDTTYRIAGDYEMLLRAGSDLKYVFLDMFTAEMEAGGISNNAVNQAFRETREAKINTAKVRPLTANIDFLIAHLKSKTKQLIRKC